MGRFHTILPAGCSRQMAYNPTLPIRGHRTAEHGPCNRHSPQRQQRIVDGRVPRPTCRSVRRDVDGAPCGSSLNYSPTLPSQDSGPGTRLMRILFLHHFPRARIGVGRLARALGRGARRAGHEARLARRRATRGGTESLPVARVVCDPLDATADLTFDLPRLPGQRRRRVHSVSSAHRRAAQRVPRRAAAALDAHIDRFDPHVLHAHHVWVFGQLCTRDWRALRAECVGTGTGRRERTCAAFALAEQAAANAGRILVPDEQTRAEVAATFETEPGRTVVAMRRH